MLEGWTTTPLSEIVEAERPITYGIVQPGQFVDDGVPMIRGGDYSGGWLPIGQIKKVSEEIDKPYERSRVRTGDIVMTLVGYTGEVAQVPPWLDGANVSRTCARITIDENKASTRFILHTLASPIGEELADRFTKGAAQPGLNLGDVRTFEVPTPPLPEQRRIAAVLDAWDAAIGTAERLVAAKRRRRDAIVGTAFTRLNAPRVALGELGELISSGVDKTTNEGEPPVVLVNYLDAYRRDFVRAEHLGHWVTAPERQKEKCTVQQGDIVFTPSSETADDAAHAAVIAEDVPNAVYSYHVVRFRPQSKELVAEYMPTVFGQRDWRRQSYERAQGSGQRFVLSLTDFREMTIPLPRKEVQKTLGAYDRTAAEEIDKLENYVQALRTQKRGLMQKLLTGEWPVPETIDALLPGGALEAAE